MKSFRSLYSEPFWCEVIIFFFRLIMFLSFFYNIKFQFDLILFLCSENKKKGTTVLSEKEKQVP